MYTLNVNDSYTFELREEGETLFHQGVKVVYDLQPLADKRFHLLYRNKSYTIDLIELNKAEKTVILNVNNKLFTINVADKFDALLKKMGLDVVTSAHLKELKSPMPGLVLQVLVKEGQVIYKGDNLIILEAMKMENILKSPVDGLVKFLKVKQGDKLEKNQLIMGF